MTFIGFIVNYMLRINLNITIVDMIVAPAANLTNVTLASNTFHLTTVPGVESIQNDSALSERYSWERQFLDWANVSKSIVITYDSCETGGLISLMYAMLYHCAYE